MPYWQCNKSTLTLSHPEEIALNIVKFFRAALAASALSAGLMHGAHAELSFVTGDTAGAATYDRPFADFSDLSPNGANASYQAYSLMVDTSGDYSVLLHGDQFDTFLFLYENAFNPATPLANGINANDDAVALNTSGFEHPLLAGTSYYLVVTGFAAGDAGKYLLSISGPGAATISAVPEPSTWLMLAFGLAAITYTARRRAQR
jgi:hypothetical protein